ncbi:unnamed protein product [Oncorhynchus mykiss]|uniref:NUP210 Ig-like domain-containing protein n=1 Tax=Oncorhynchus mykiss TaxID=8022 RepID=A0A060XJH3_ONCMY|nr:unnamed protein product [Oncorhynchus mykiss]
MANEEIASVNGIDHVRGVAIGNVTVTGLIQAVDTEPGKLGVSCKIPDQVEVEVVQLRAIRIQAPITRMKTGTQMPVYVIGLSSSQTPFSFGNALPGLTFHWTTTKRDILELQSRHAEASVQLQPEHNFAMSVTGKTKGRTGIKVVLKRDELLDELQIQVYDKLHMLNPAMEAKEILMAPTSGLKLQTSRDGVCSLYPVLDCPNQATIAQVDEKGLLSSGSLTGSSSLLVTSQETFGVNQTLVLAVKVRPSGPLLQFYESLLSLRQINTVQGMRNNIVHYNP